MIQPVLLFLGLGAQELIFIALIVLLLFGGKKIPEMMRGLGRGVKSFKDGMSGVDEMVNDLSSEKNSTEKAKDPEESKHE